jgi:hypothetical protein
MRITHTLTVLLLLSVAVVPSASAHASGFSLEEKVGNYLVDVGYDQELVAEQQILFDFNLFNIRRDGVEEKADYSDVYVELSLNNNTVYSRKIANNVDTPSTTAAFPASGSYALKVQFLRGDQLVAEHTFSVSVANPVQNTGFVTPFDIFEVAMYSVGVMICVIAGLGLWISGRRKKPLVPPV